jgi:hypothetical protein
LLVGVCRAVACSPPKAVVERLTELCAAAARGLKPGRAWNGKANGHEPHRLRQQ